MFKRKPRGGAVVEIGKSVGATLSVLGAFIACKASTEMNRVAYTSDEVMLTPGDLYLPFANTQAAVWVGLTIATVGVVMRLLSYLNLYKKAGKLK